MRIYVGNLSYDVTDQDLTAAFSPYGKINSAQVVMDRATNRSKGFGFVEMPELKEGQAAIKGLDGKDLKGRAMTVNPAREKTEDRGGRRY